MKEKITQFAGSLIAKMLLLFPRILATVKEKAILVKTIDYSREKIFIQIDSNTEIARLSPCAKEPITVNWIESFIEPGDVVFDIGANVGTYSLIIDKYTNGKAKIYAFEPSFSTFAQLCRNIYLNKSKGVVPMYMALSDKTKICTFNYTSLEAGTALHALGEPIDYKNERFSPVFEQKIISFCIDDLLEILPIETPNHMKIDVDGIELEILKGAIKTLDNPKLKTMNVEVIEEMESSTSIIKLLEQKGYQIYASYRRGTPMTICNHIFVRQGILQNKPRD